MQMEKAEKEELQQQSSLSVIGANIIINGNIDAASDPGEIDLQIEGRVNGDVHCATVVLTERSHVKGNITAERVRVSGTVDGGIQTKELAVEATARVTGDVVYEHIRIANGGIVQGNMKWNVASAGQTEERGKLKLVEGTPEPPQAVYIE
jgi:cytoskeletal protein CcmA (bactofilin family)